MRFFQVVMSGAALISAALAVEFNSWPSTVKAGETVTLTYSPKDAATTILLKKGLSTDLKTLTTLTTSSTGGSFEWTVPSDLADGADYAFEIQQAGAEPNYSGQFALSGGAAASSSAASSSVAPSSSAGYATKESSSSASETASETASSSAEYSTAISTTISTAVITSHGTASGTGALPTHGTNSTISTGSPSATSAGGNSPSTTNEPPVENTGAASSFGINAAALFGAIGAFAYFA